MSVLVTMTCPDCRGVRYPQRVGTIRRCWTCTPGAGVAPTGEVTIDEAAIRKAIANSRTGGLRKSKPVSSPTNPAPYGAEFVWRMARFHGGADVSMPVMCFFSIGISGIIRPEGRAVLDVLEPIADAVAKEEFGSDMHAALRWGKAMGWTVG